METEKVTIKKFLQKNNTDYAISVFSYKLRLEMEHRNYSLKYVQYIDIERQYISNPVRIILKDICTSQIDSFALLLSLRAIILDHSLLNKCDDNHLLFTDLTLGYIWLDYMDIIQKMSTDPEFYNLFQIMKELKDSKTISSDTLSVFATFTVDPGQENIEGYYKSLSSTLKKVSNGVIPDHYYIEADFLENYTVSSNIKYIGSGAFAYCKNLASITFKAKDTLLGPFAILECDNLKEIIVPDESLDYYKGALPYYKDIIISQSVADGIQEEPVSEPISQPEPELKEEPEPEPIPVSESKPDTVIHVIQVPDNDQEPMVEIGVISPSVPVFSAFDSSKLKSVFDSKVTTYKYFWYLGFLSILKEKQTKSIPIVDIEIMMIAKAWRYLYEAELDFGPSDQMKKIADDIRKKTYLIQNASESVVFNQLHYHIDSLKGILAPLSKNVPFRFISPWIKYSSDQEVMEASHTQSAAPYALYKDRIEFDDNRLQYFTEHYDEQLSFIKDSLKEYLKKYNSVLKMLLLMLN